MRKLYNKIYRKLHNIFIKKINGTFFYPLFYLSWWHSIIYEKKIIDNDNNRYMTAVPNPDAGIGHQLANWNAGLWFAKKFNLQFAHSPFTPTNWDSFLGLGWGKKSANDLIKLNGYKKIILPLFDENNYIELDRIEKIINSYSSNKVLFMLEIDQGYKDQFGVIEEMKNSFYSAPARKELDLMYSVQFYNIAIHIRRGDILKEKNSNPNLSMRWQDSSYFESVLKIILSNLIPSKPIKVHLFSQGTLEEFIGFSEIAEIEYHLDMSEKECFIHMVYADLLITSKSSFSYKPALLSNGIRVCPKDFWHGYPDDHKWIIANEDGSLDKAAIIKLASLH